MFPVSAQYPFSIRNTCSHLADIKTIFLSKMHEKTIKYTLIWCPEDVSIYNVGYLVNHSGSRQ